MRKRGNQFDLVELISMHWISKSKMSSHFEQSLTRAVNKYRIMNKLLCIRDAVYIFNRKA